MSGDIMDAMEEAISSSDIVVVVFSKGYAKSENCKKECKYAVKRGTILVSTIMLIYASSRTKTLSFFSIPVHNV